MARPPIDEAALRYAWSRWTVSYICEMLGCGHRTLYYYVRKYNLGPKPEGTHARRTCRRRPDPTPEQIAKRAAKIRADWTPAERARRAGKSKASVAMRALGYDGRTVRFSERLL